MKATQLRNFDNRKLKESVIIERILDGEKELFEILIRRNNQKLYRTIRSYLKEDAEVEDVMQNSYIKAYTKLYQFRKDALFSTWLIRIAINEALARLKEKGKRYDLSIDSDTPQSNRVIHLPDERELNPQQKMIHNETQKLLEKAIDSLEPNYRIVYVLKEVEEMKIKDVAEALDISESNVKVRVHRAKTMLKDLLFDLSQDKNIFEFGFSRCDRITERVMDQI
jgi:RNA polymerase sigma-70 factor (ECF subfamily)